MVSVYIINGIYYLPIITVIVPGTQWQQLVGGSQNQSSGLQSSCVMAKENNQFSKLLSTRVTWTMLLQCKILPGLETL